MSNQEIIKKLLKNNSQGLSITDLATKSKLARQTISIILARLEGENKIVIRPVGQAKLHYWKMKNDILPNKSD